MAWVALWRELSWYPEPHLGADPSCTSTGTFRKGIRIPPGIHEVQRFASVSERLNTQVRGQAIVERLTSGMILSVFGKFVNRNLNMSTRASEH